MPRGSKTKYTDKQERQADHIAEDYKKKGMSEKRAKGIARATVNEEFGRGEKSGSGRRKSAAAKKKSRKSVGKSAARTRRRLGTGKDSKRAKKPPAKAYVRKGRKSTKGRKSSKGRKSGKKSS
ncbi:MAG: hypothetical protein K2Y22_12210 [Candidatus Obscuribacterales bacterium]|nr:hypothetical protein [Candidatus Obscuribacterales bacterium]